jgi:hypothetical protein
VKIFISKIKEKIEKEKINKKRQKPKKPPN